MGWVLLCGWLVVATLSLPVAGGYTADLTVPWGSASASSTFGTLSPADVFDNVPAFPAIPSSGEIYWGSEVKVVDTPQWLKYDFGAGNEKTLRRYRLLTTYNTGFQPDDWEFQGSNNDATWTELDSVTDAALSRQVWYTYDFSNSTAYRYYRIYVTGVADDTGNEWVDINEMEMMEWVGAPEIDVQRPSGPANSIVDDGSDDVGTQTVGTVNLTYTIDNSAGAGPLTIPIGGVTAENLSNAENFTVVTGLPLNVNAGASGSLQVQFDVKANGVFSLDMDIDSNDADESTYDIRISGTGTGGQPEINVKRGAASIPDGNTDNVGNQSVGTVNLTYTIDNTAGTAQLTIPVGGVTAENLSNAENFTVVTGLPLNVNAGASGSLQVQFDVKANGVFSLDMDIDSNDADESTYEITIAGTGVGPVNPTATTHAATGVTSSGATLNGTVNANEADATVAFEYGLTTAYGTTATANQSPVTGTTDTAVTASVTGLTPNTMFHYRVVAQNSVGTAYGEDMTFSTGALPPTATTHAASEITATTATLNGTVNANADDTTVTFHYGVTPSYGTAVTADQSPLMGSTDTAVTAPVTNLTPNTTYYFRVAAHNLIGTTYGAQMPFSTLLHGDINGDGLVDLIDVLMLYRYVEGVLEMTSVDVARSDIDGDGDVDEDDAAALVVSVFGS
ncbi:choice-of-anchor D domain-containing protein [Candidatus Bipolaricaulota bacterium]